MLTWTALAWSAARMLMVRAEMEHADALVVLGGSSTYAERTQRAAELFRQGCAPKILLTNDGQRGGWSDLEERNPFFIERAATELQRVGVPKEKIEMLPKVVSSTYDEAVLLREHTTTYGLRSLMVVTSPFHSRRALWTLRRVFRGSSVVVGLDIPLPSGESPPPATWWLFPHGWQMVPSEYVKLIYYYLKYN